MYNGVIIFNNNLHDCVRRICDCTVGIIERRVFRCSLFLVLNCLENLLVLFTVEESKVIVCRTCDRILIL